jgi:hypothetical protein
MFTLRVCGGGSSIAASAVTVQRASPFDIV